MGVYTYLETAWSCRILDYVCHVTGFDRTIEVLGLVQYLLGPILMNGPYLFVDI